MQLHRPDSSQETKPKPVPPAIIATCLNLRIFGSDFLSGRMANWPVAEKEGKFPVWERLSFPFNAVPQWHLLTTAAVALQLTVSVVHQQSTGPPEVNRVPDDHVVQVLGQLSSLWERGMGVLVVHLVTSQQEEWNGCVTVAGTVMLAKRRLLPSSAVVVTFV